MVTASEPVLEMLEDASTLDDPQVTAAVDDFLLLHARARHALEYVHLTDTGGWGGGEDDAERTYADAEDAWKTVAQGWAAGAFVPQEVLDLGCEHYAFRPSMPPARSGLKEAA